MAWRQRIPRPRFSLQALLLFVLLVASGIGICLKWYDTWTPRWQVTTGGEVEKMVGYSPDGRWFCTLQRAANQWDLYLQLWAADTGVLGPRLDVGQTVRKHWKPEWYRADSADSSRPELRWDRVSWFPDAQQVITYEDNRMTYIWDVPSGETRCLRKDRGFGTDRCLSFSPDGSYAVFLHDGFQETWVQHLPTGAILGPWKAAQDPQYDWAPDMSWVARRDWGYGDKDGSDLMVVELPTGSLKCRWVSPLNENFHTIKALSRRYVALSASGYEGTDIGTLVLPRPHRTRDKKRIGYEGCMGIETR